MFCDSYQSMQTCGFSIRLAQMSSKMCSAVMSPLKVMLFMVIMGQYMVPRSIHFFEFSYKMVLLPLRLLPRKESVTQLSFSAQFSPIISIVGFFSQSLTDNLRKPRQKPDS